MNEIIETLKKQFDIIDSVQQRNNLSFISVEKDCAIPLISFMKGSMGFVHLVILSTVDYIEDNKFQLTYLLNNPEKHIDVGVRVLIDRDNPEMYSAHNLWGSIATYQREIREMFGINFPGSPRVDEEFILEGWDDIPPYRRDFDTLKYSEERFFPREGRVKKDPKEYMSKKLYKPWEKKVEEKK